MIHNKVQLFSISEHKPLEIFHPRPSSWHFSLSPLWLAGGMWQESRQNVLACLTDKCCRCHGEGSHGDGPLPSVLFSNAAVAALAAWGSSAALQGSWKVCVNMLCVQTHMVSMETAKCLVYVCILVGGRGSFWSGNQDVWPLTLNLRILDLVLGDGATRYLISRAEKPCLNFWPQTDRMDTEHGVTSMHLVKICEM